MKSHPNDFKNDYAAFYLVSPNLTRGQILKDGNVITFGVANLGIRTLCLEYQSKGCSLIRIAAELNIKGLRTSKNEVFNETLVQQFLDCTYLNTTLFTCSGRAPGP